MGVKSAAGAVAAKDGGITGVIRETHSLVMDVGPAWGLGIVVAICIFLPKFGVLVNLAALFKEDRADARKRKVDSERLASRYRNRQLPPNSSRKKEKE